MITYIIIFSAKKRTKFFAPLGTVGFVDGPNRASPLSLSYSCGTTCWVSVHTLRYARGVLTLTLSLSCRFVFVLCFLCHFSYCPYDIAHLAAHLAMYTIHIFCMSGPANSTFNHGGRTQRANGTVRIHPTSLSPHAPHALLFLSLFPKSNKSSPTTRAPWRRLS
jgi:hypothetical protein